MSAAGGFDVAGAAMTGRVRAARAQLFWLDGHRDVATLTVDDDLPLLLMVDGEPFLRADAKGLLPWPADRDEPRYFQVKPYRVDAGLLEGC